MILAILISQYAMFVFWLVYTGLILALVIIALNAIRQTLKTIALDILQILQAIKSQQQDIDERRQLFEDNRQIARQRLQANRKLLASGQSALVSMAWQAGKFDIEVSDAKH